MTAQSEIIRQSNLLNQLVIDRSTMEELGHLEVLWMHPELHRVLGFICKSGWLGTQKMAFKLSQIVAIGSNGILTHSQPEATDAEKVKLLESLLNHEAWSDTGDKIGKINDCLFDLQTGKITQYLFVSNGWSGITGELYELPPSQILSFGKKRVLVSADGMDHFQLYQEGIRHKLTKTGELLKEEATQEWRSLAQRAETLKEHTQERLQTFTEEARERAHYLSRQTHDKTQTLNQHLTEKAQTILENAKEKSQRWMETLKQHTQQWSQQVEERAETLTVQAEEVFESMRTEPIDPGSSHPPNSQPDCSQGDRSPDSSRFTPHATPSDLSEDDDEPWI
jgi:uncharacterized protein YrrD